LPCAAADTLNGKWNTMMSQTKSAENDKTTEQARSNGNKAVDAANETVESGKQALRDVSERTERHAEKSMDVALQAVEDTGKQLHAANKSGNELAGFWLSTMQAQTTHNIEAMQELAKARDWQDKLAVQSEFFSISLKRLQDVFSRYMEMTGSTLQGQAETGAANAKKATKAAAAA
jgi:hypothetical protein